MARPEAVHLHDGDLRWRSVPMPGANRGIDVVPLASAQGRTTMVARFPAGFERATPGGYLAAEEVVLLDGFLELEGVRYGAGSWLHIPAGFRRTEMRSADGATALAWFGGAVDFLTPEELPEVVDPITSRDLGSLAVGASWQTPESTWRLGTAADRGQDEEYLDVQGAGWARAATVVADSDRLLFRTPR
ncbi:cupin domain-containing protein [Nocardioides sp. Bht2]|uniref:cupin domain-containing protein n=1 Tax=Nocardioides sp. Bht2 TaxID=3392297 RepID=UPI0039B44305